VREGGGLRQRRRGRPTGVVAGPGLGEAEVEDLDLPVGGELDVRGLQVAVDDARAVRLLEGLRDLLRDLDGLVDGDRPPPEALLEVLALDQLQREEGLPLGLLEPVDGGDVGVVEGGEEVGLALEAGEALGVLHDLGGQHLDGHFAVEVGVGGPIDLAHPPGPEGGGDAVVRQRLTDHEDLLNAERDRSNTWMWL
jgi:hypothetical protein